VVFLYSHSIVEGLAMSNIKLKTPKNLNPKRCSPRWALLDGVSVRYTISGEIGRPLLLLHEMGGSLESWDPVLDHLPSNQIIIRCDMRGAGGSEKIRAATTCNALSDDIAALLNYLGVSGANVAGVAIGGCMSLKLAVRHPHLVYKLAPINPPIDAFGRAGEVLRDRAVLTDAQGMRAVVDSALARSYPDVLREVDGAYEAYVARFITNDPSSYAHILRALLSVNFEGELERISCPTLFIAGRLDMVRRPEDTSKAALRVPGAGFLEVEGGHIPSIQAPAALAATLTNFFDM